MNFTITGDQPAGGGASGGAAVPSPGGGGGFSLSRDEAQSMLTVAKRVRDNLRHMNTQAEALRKIRPPTDDPGSTSYNTLLVGDGRGGGAFGEGADQVGRELKYAGQLVSKLELALGITVAADENAGADVKAAAGDQDKGFA
ncbi:hypothetical protein AB0383_00060 [Amycolatopsis sp. NPDC051373]|uniref:hypothetical protein n=1 Tax=Amycolatopsis sp. NPDC051373 TaxID=3155801 RepID=UPI00344BA083